MDRPYLCKCDRTVELNETDRCDECGDQFCNEHFYLCEFDETVCDDCFAKNTDFDICN